MTERKYVIHGNIPTPKGQEFVILKMVIWTNHIGDSIIHMRENSMSPKLMKNMACVGENK